MAIVPTTPPGWYRTRDELPYGKLTLVTGRVQGRRLVVYELRPWTGPDGTQRLVCYRERVFPGDIRRNCAKLLRFPPATWRGMPTAEAVATAERRDNE